MASIRGNVEIDSVLPCVYSEIDHRRRQNVESELAWQQKKDFANNPGYLPPSKLISLQRQSNGFGFTLRHFVVYPPELIKKTSEPGSGPGVNGLDHHVDDIERQKAEPMDTVFVRQVAPSGPADRAGLSTGDQIVSVNGQPVMGRSYSQVIELIRSSQELLELGIIPKEDCVLQMVTPTLSIPPSITVGSHEISQSPPPVKPKPMYRRLSSHDSPTRVMSTVTINPANSYHLKMSDKASQSSVAHGNDTSTPVVTLRRGSVDRTAMENRSFVITSESMDYNSNLKSRSSSTLESSAVNSPRMDGSYFMAATDSTGRPLALRFEKGSKMGNTLTVLEDSRTKTRSHSLPVVEMQGFGERNRASSNVSAVDKVNSMNLNDGYTSNDMGHGSASTPPFMLSAPRTVASDSPSTTYMNTSPDMGSRQPVAADPGYKKGRASYEETTSYLIRTIASHMNKDRQGGLKSSTVGTTLLESKEGQPYRQSGGNERWAPPDSNAELYKDADCPHPAKVLRQSEDQVKQGAYSSQVSVFPNKPAFDEMHFTPTIGPTEVESSAVNKQGSPKPRRVSYLMATSRGSSSLSDQKIWSTAPQGKKPGKSSLFEAFSTMLPPVMVHVSSGMELCEDVNGDEGMEIPTNEQEDEVFSVTADDKSATETTVQRSNRRISYVMATSSPSSPRHEASLEATKEEEENKERSEQIPGMLEVCKEGLLWRKVAVVDGGKRSSARSWKPVFAVLRGHVLYLHKDKGSAHQEDSSDEQPISIKSSIVDIAHDYTKRKNVFRMTTFNGSEFLFQTEDHASMMSWIAAIQANNNPDEDENGVSSQSLIIRRMKTVEQETSGSNTVSPSHKLSPPVNTKMPGIPGISNIKKSLSFKNITTGQKGESGKTHGNKSSKKRKKPQHPNSYPSGHSVGVPLELCPASKNNKFVPLIVEHCCDVVERKGLETVGVYRVPGNSAAVTALQEELNNRGIENVCLEEEKWNDVNNITSLLKLFLRKLPEGLVTADLYDAFIESNKKEDAAERMWSIRSVVQELPDHNFETLKLLVNHLKLVSDNCDKNKMEVRNLAIVFGPTIIRTGDDSMMAMVKDMSDQCRIVETLISECDWFFEETEGDECPVKAIPPSQELPQEHILSQNVLSSLGQVAVNFGEDGSYKPKSSGISLHIPKFRSGKTSKSDSGQGSSSDGPLSDSQGSEGSPPTERAPAVKILTGEGSRSNSPTMERSKLGGKRGVESSSASIQMVLDPSDAEFRPKGAGSLKAYSYSHPPPPSYRRVNPQKRATSPSTLEQPFYPLEVNFTSAQDSEVRKSPDEPPSASPSEQDNASKPSFASFSEETRRRLLKLNLQKKAAEKRRQSEGEREMTSPPSERSDEVPRDAPRERKISDQGMFESMDQLSSSSTSRSSSAHSSKNPSLDSLHVSPQPQLDKVASLPVASHSETPRVNGGVKTMSLPNEAHREVVPRSNETVVAVVKGRGVVSGTLRQFEPARRPASLDIPTKRENAEEVRLARRSLGSEESSDTSSDEGDECAISMSKTFDEKLRILLDLGSTFGNKESGGDTHSDDDKSSVRSEPQRRPITNTDEIAQRRASDEPARMYKIVGVNLSTDTHETVSTPFDTRTTVPRDASRDETPETELRSNSLIEINTSKYFAAPSTEERTSSQPPSPARTVASEGTPVSSDKKVGDLRQRFESSPSKGKVSGLTPKSNQVRGRDYAPSVARKKIGSVRTTTPVSLKEFNVKPAGVKTSAAQPVQVGGAARGVQRGTAQRPPESRAVSSRSIRLESSPVKHSSTSPIRYSAGRTDSGVDRTTPRSRPNANVATNERSKGQPVVGKTYVPPRVMIREYGTKSKLLSHKDSAKELLPSKTRIPPRDVRGSQTQSKLEKDAQHIAELLEEMHSERYLHLSRQQSDISGQAQKAAAQRAAIRRRRRSLGDDNNAVALQMANSPADERENTSTHTGMEVTQGGYNAWRHEANLRPNSPQRGGNTTRSAVHTVKR